VEHFSREYTRRTFLRSLGTAGLGLVGSPIFAEEIARWIGDGGFAQELVRTPSQTEGPFYPDKLPLDVDNDLIVMRPSTSPAIGQITQLHGRVLNLRGEPISGATVEIWQVDNNGAYIHSDSDNREKLDKNFQGFGRFETASDGAYRFRTIKPVSYPGRTPHIHVKVKRGDRELLTTQCYVAGERQNDRDGVLLGVSDPKVRASVIVPFEKVKDSPIGELTAKFDIVLGITPSE
jgi:protocatechuate 3,4-dioxygenase beta subunit